MKKGLLAHYCCSGNTIHKHSIVWVDDSKLYDIAKFAGETPHTKFYDGMLIVVASSFEPQCNLFITQLQHALKENTELTIDQAILNNKTFTSHPAIEGNDCLIYSISTIEWSSMRPTTTDAIKITLLNK